MSAVIAAAKNPAQDRVVYVDYLAELHAAIERAGGDQAYADKLGIPVRAVWLPRDQAPTGAVLRDLALTHVEAYYRS